MLHRRTKIPYAHIKLGRTEKGKPYLMNNAPEGCERLSFNVSHHGDYVVLAAETFTDVGIDVMKLETPGTIITLICHLKNYNL
jgi:4'-phosphopantetheinyl transferase